MKSEIKKIAISAFFTLVWILQSANYYNKGRNVPLYVVCVFAAFMLMTAVKNRGIGILSGLAVHAAIAIIDINYLMISLPLYFLALAHKEITSMPILQTDKKKKDPGKDYAFMFIWLNAFSLLAISVYVIIGWFNEPPEYIAALTMCLQKMYWFFIMFIPLVILSFRKVNKKKNEDAAFTAQAKSLRIIYIFSMITFVVQVLLYYVRHLDGNYIVTSIFMPWMVYISSMIVCDEDAVVEYIAKSFKAVVDKIAVANKVEEK